MHSDVAQPNYLQRKRNHKIRRRTKPRVLSTAAHESEEVKWRGQLEEAADLGWW